jgi:hypothetical protein
MLRGGETGIVRWVAEVRVCAAGALLGTKSFPPHSPEAEADKIHGHIIGGVITHDFPAVVIPREAASSTYAAAGFWWFERGNGRSPLVRITHDAAVVLLLFWPFWVCFELLRPS